MSDERRAALRSFFEESQRGQNRGVTFVEVSDILGVLDDVEAAEQRAAALEDLLYVPHYPETYGLKPYVADGEECCDCLRMRGSGHGKNCRVGRFFEAAADGSDSSPSAEPPKTEPTAVVYSDGRGDAMCSACGAVIECRHNQEYLTAHRPDCPLAAS